MITKSTLRLFKGIYVPTIAEYNNDIQLINETTIKYGFIFSKEIIQSHCLFDLNRLIIDVSSELYLTSDQLNNALHKSWNVVKSSSEEKLLFDQILHYITTYGYEALNISGEVYIPAEALNIPEIKMDKIKIIIIKGYTRVQLKEKIDNILKSGIALKLDTQNDIINIIRELEINIDIEIVKNAEIRCILYNNLNIVPKTAIELIRYIIYRCTNNPQIIMDKKTIESIKDKSQYVDNYLLITNPIELSKVFLRFKPIFLALKTNGELRSSINKIRKLARIYHEPLEKDYLNSLFTKKFDKYRLQYALDNANIFRQIRLLYATHNRMQRLQSVVYKIRNGKSYAKSIIYDQSIDYKQIYSIIEEKIVAKIAKNLNGKKVYFDPNFTYILPTSEKMFCGNIPNGSFIQLPNTMIIGIQWDNFKKELGQYESPYYNSNRVDIDLSLLSAEDKYGWNSRFRSDDDSGDILYSGDMTDARNGAVEAFYIKKHADSIFSLMLNRYNPHDVDIPYKLFVAEDNPTLFQKIQGHKYIVDPNNVKTIIPMILDADQKMIGIIATTNKQTRLYFGESELGKGIVCSNDKPYIQQSRDYYAKTYLNQISLNDLIKKAKITVVKNQEDADVDLSIEKLQKDTIINLLI